jgi:hypothetical protein
LIAHSEKTFAELDAARYRRATSPAYDPAFETCRCESPDEHELGRCRPIVLVAAPCSCDEALELRTMLAEARSSAALFELRINRALAIASAPAARLVGDGGPSKLERVMEALHGKG